LKNTLKSTKEAKAEAKICSKLLFAIVIYGNY